MAENIASGPSMSSSLTDPSAPVDDNARHLPLEELKSQEWASLLGAIDSLRQEQLDVDINIPQIVVCGDQSSGKSSVLEAISGVTFPLGATTTTRFATEVILRKSDKEHRSVRVIASSNRSPEERTRIQSFQPTDKSPRPQDFENLIIEADRHLRREPSKERFCTDHLRVEIFGPNQPHLTLVDLPGIIHYDGEENTVKGDADKIKKLVEGYIQKPRTTVLAIVNAFNNIENQTVIDLTTRLARDRTLGILTKVDVLAESSEEQDIAVRIARDQKVRLGLGWHVLVNRRHDADEARSPVKRDEEERAKLSRGPWTQVDAAKLGIQALRKRLSRHLFDSITHDLGRLVKDMEHQRDQRTAQISQLGPARPALGQQKQYLGKVLEKFSRLIEDGLEENFGRKESKNFFGAFEDRRLRYVIRDRTDRFANRMRKDGRQYHIFLANGEHGFVSRNDTLDMLPEDETLNFYFPYMPRPLADSGKIAVYNVPLKRYCATLREHIKGTRGKDLRGTSTTKNIADVFRQLSVPWEVLAKDFAEKCISAVSMFLRAACYEAGGDHTGADLLQAYVLEPDSRFQHRRARLNLKIEELLWPYTECHPMTSRLEFNAALASQAYTNGNLGDKSWVDLATDAPGYTEGMVEAAGILAQTESYYKIALDNFIDNVASLGIEMCLLKDLSKLVEPNEVHMMEDELVSKLAAEPPGVAARREKAEKQVAVLSKVIATCSAYLPLDPETTSSKQQPLNAADQMPTVLDTRQGRSPAPQAGEAMNRSNKPDGAPGGTDITPSGFGANINFKSSVIQAKPGGGGLFDGNPSIRGTSPRPNSSQFGTPAPGEGLFGATASTLGTSSSTGGLFGVKNPSPQPGPSKASVFGAHLSNQGADGATSAGNGSFGSASLFSRPGSSTGGLFSTTSGNQGAATGGFGYAFDSAPRKQGQSTGSPFGQSNGEQSKSAEKSGSLSLGGFGSHSNAGKSQEPVYYTTSKGTAQLHFKSFPEKSEGIPSTTNLYQHLSFDPSLSRFSAEVSFLVKQ